MLFVIGLNLYKQQTTSHLYLMTCQSLQSQRTTTTITTIAIIVENIIFEQIKGIEPSSPVWQTGALAVVLYLQNL